MPERESAIAVLDGLAYEPLLYGKVTIEGVAWDKRGAGAPLLAGITPQESIAAGLPTPAQCDIVVVIFWARMGTPLPDSYRKHDGSRYESGTEWEYENAVSAYRAGGAPFVLLYRRSETVLLDPEASDFEERVAQYAKVRRFFESLKNPDGSYRDGYTGYERPSDFSAKLEHDLKSLIARILAEPPRHAGERSGIAAPKIWPTSPFPGLRAFTAADAPVFFGREREVDALIRRVTAQPFVAVVGASGGGKSSLVAAGMIPRLQLTAQSGGEGSWVTIHTTPDQVGVGNPFASMAAALLAADPRVRKKNFGTILRQSPERLAELLAEMTSAAGEARALLFIDQFEELFTTVHPEFRDPFVEMLRRAAAVPAVRIVITLRADFYGKCVEQQTLAGMIEDGTFPLPAPGLGALAEMITKPAARAALTYEDALPQRILDDTGDEPGALALMAYTLDELYRRCGDSGTLTHAAYESVGGVRGAIGKRSEGVFERLADDERAALPRVFRELVDVDERGTATRQRATLSRVAGTAAALRLTTALTEARLLVQSRGEGNVAVVEVAHEALFRSWSRLADWINERQEDLRLLRQVRRAAEEWHASGRRDDFLWSHERLAPVYALRERLDIDEFEPVVADFIRPEFERLVAAVRTDARHYRQRPHIERLEQIGAPAAESLVQCLPYAKARTAVFTIHRAIGRIGTAAVPFLIAASASTDVVFRAKAIDAFPAVRSEAIIDALPRLMQDQEDEVKMAALRAAAQIGDERLLTPVLRLANDVSSVVRKFAAMTLGAFGSEAAIKGLAILVSDRNPSVQSVALGVIEVLANERRSYMRVIDTELRFRDIGILRERVTRNRGKLGRSPALDMLVGALAELVNEDGPVRSEAAAILALLGTRRAIDALLAAAKRASRKAADPLFDAIGTTQSTNVAPGVIALLQSRKPHIRAGAARAIAALVTSPWPRPTASVRAMREALVRHDVIPRITAALVDADFRVRRGAIAVAGALQLAEASSILLQYAAEGDDEMRRLSAEGLAELGEKKAVPVLVRMIDGPYMPAATAAAHALVRLGAEEAGRAAADRFSRIIDNPAMDNLAAALVPLVLTAPGGDVLLEQVPRTGDRFSLWHAIDSAIDEVQF